MAAKTIEVHDELLMQIDRIARSLSLTPAEWIAHVLANAVRKESAREKILDVVSAEYLNNKIDFRGMVDLIGYDDAVRIKSVSEGAKRSITEADEFVKKLRVKK
jgi:hypothetical protein